MKSLLLIRNADVLAPRPLGLCTVLIGSGKILWLGAPGELPGLPPSLAGTTVTLDLEGRRLIPGLIDGHVHVTGGGGEAGFSTRVPAIPLSRFTTSGVTTVVGLLGTDDIARGPRELLASVYALREQGLNAWALTGGYHVPAATLTRSVRSDLVFIEALLGIGEVAISDHRSSQPTVDELLRLGSIAHVAGLMTGKAGIVHVHVGDGLRGLELIRQALSASELPAGVFNPTHINRRRALFEEAVELAGIGSTVDITAFPVKEGEEGWSAAEALIRYHASGAPPARITVSSDAGGCLPCFDVEGRVTSMEVGSAGALLGTLRELQERGMPLEQALPAFTTNPARLLRLAGKGSVRAGGDADLVALDATGKAETVIIGGTVHVSAGDAVRRGTFETADTPP